MAKRKVVAVDQETLDHFSQPSAAAAETESVKALNVPFIESNMGDIRYFLFTLPFREVVKRLRYQAGVPDTPPEERYQRMLNDSRVRNSLVPYLATENHFFPPLVATCRTKDVRTDHTTIELKADTTFPVLDGQHRLAAIEEYLETIQESDKLTSREKEKVLNEGIGVVLLEDMSLQKEQQLFSDLNRNQKIPPKALGILFDQRDIFAVVAKKVSKMGVWKGRVNLESNTLSKKTPYIITLAMMYEVVKPFLVVNPGARSIVTELKPEFQDQSVDDTAEELARVLEEVIFDALPAANDIRTVENIMAQLRGVYICYTSLGWQAISRATSKAIDFGIPEKEIVNRLQAINWKMDDPAWKHVVTKGKILVRRDSIELATGIIERELTKPYQKVVRRRRGAEQELNLSR